MSTTPEYRDLLRDLQRFVDKPREGWVLSPKPVQEELPLSASKFGGSPYPSELDQWPNCPDCHVPLQFVLQLNKRQFPQMWFPRNKTLFQLFRCPSHYCDWKNLRHADRYMLAHFSRTRPGRITAIERPEAECEDEHIDDHKLTVRKVRDYPSSYEDRESWWGDSWARFQKKYASQFGDDFFEAGFWDLIPNQDGIKVAGLPSWQQGGYPPTCRCGRQKEFIFQLASIEQPGIEIMIGDAGNIYYFVCRRCGEDSLESTWDCG